MLAASCGSVTFEGHRHLVQVGVTDLLGIRSVRIGVERSDKVRNSIGLVNVATPE
jgi:hypothetical protein